MTKHSDDPTSLFTSEDVSNGLSVASAALSLAHKAGAPFEDADKYAARIQSVDGVLKTGTSILAGGSAVAAATSLTVAATSGAGIATGLAAAGSVVGGGMAVGPMAIAAGPTYFAVKTINQTLFSEAPHLHPQEAAARKKARAGTKVGGTMGIAAAGATVIAGGASGPAIMGTLATVGSLVGGGAVAGTFVVIAAPMAAALAAGFGAYRLFGGGKKKATLP